MPSPNKTVDDPARRILVDALPPPERTPAEMLAVLRAMVNRQVAFLEGMVAANGGTLPLALDDYLDVVLDRVCKLSREDRAREPTDEELLAEHDRENGGGS